MNFIKKINNTIKKFISEHKQIVLDLKSIESPLEDFINTLVHMEKVRTRKVLIEKFNIK